MRPPLPVMASALIVAVLLGGCLGDGAPTPAPPDIQPNGDGAPAPELGPRLAGDPPILLTPWLDAATVQTAPNAERQVQIAYTAFDDGAFRVLTDGEAFHLLADLDRARDGVLLARVFDAEFGTLAARGTTPLAPGSGVVTLPLPAVDLVRIGSAYAVEVVWFEPEAAVADAYEIGTDGGQIVPRPGAPDVWNGTVRQHWNETLSFRATWDLAFDGPTEGSDRVDPLEHPAFGGPPTGTYVARLFGERIWAGNVLMEFGASDVVSSEPDAGDGETSLQFEVRGHRPLADYQAFPRDRGLNQSFAIEVVVDWESGDDVPEEVQQVFFYTVQFAYRQGGTSYGLDSDGRHITVTITPETLP